MKKLIQILAVLAGWYGIAILTTSYVELQKKIEAPVIFGTAPRVSTTSWDQGFVSFTGTFKYDKSGTFYPPINMVDGHCIKQIEGCNLAFAVVSPAGNDSVLSVVTDSFNVTQWNRDTIVFENSHPCYKTVFSINRATSTLTGAEVFPGDKGGECEKGQNVTISLVNGSEHYQQLQKKSNAYGIANLIGLALLLVGALFLSWKIAKPAKPL